MPGNAARPDHDRETGEVTERSRPRALAWAEPSVDTVAFGVHRIPLPLPTDVLAAVNVYVIETEDGLTVVDGGWSIPEARSQFEWALGQLGYGLRDITEFLVTHAHRDHYTQAAALEVELGCRVRLGAGEQAYLAVMQQDPVGGRAQEDLLERAGAAHLIPEWRVWLEDQPKGTEVWAAPTSWLADGEHLPVGSRALQAWSTPGHTQGHFVFADERAGLLFAGDHVLPTITPSVGFEPVPTELALGDFIGSLAKVRQLPDMRLLAAHGPVADSSHARIDELLTHHAERLNLCLDAVGTGAATACDVAAQLPWTRRARRLEQMDAYNAALAVMETMLHLDLLVAQERLAATERDGLRHWSIVAAG